MHIVETLTGQAVEVEVLEVNVNDFKRLNSKRYFFNWNKFKTGYNVFKLQKTGEDDILGVMALIDVPDEYRIEIALICTSLENYSHSKQYDRIAGCLIAFACRESIKKYEGSAAVSLLPKTKIREYYKQKYGMEDAGKQLVLLDNSLSNVLNQYI